ncbi:hypothetical protein HQ576_10070 [bacterium]|nr:hypothetical protein [bacterium]
MTLSETQARALVDRILALASADDVRVNLGGGRQANEDGDAKGTHGWICSFRVKL